jgi:hypothetical protein
MTWQPGKDFRRTFRASLMGIELSIVDRRETDVPGRYHFDYEFHCLRCGGYEMSVPDDGDAQGDVCCSACGHRFASLGQIQQLCRQMGEQELKRIGL